MSEPLEKKQRSPYDIWDKKELLSLRKKLAAKGRKAIEDFNFYTLEEIKDGIRFIDKRLKEINEQTGEVRA